MYSNHFRAETYSWKGQRWKVPRRTDEKAVTGKGGGTDAKPHRRPECEVPSVRAYLKAQREVRKGVPLMCSPALTADLLLHNRICYRRPDSGCKQSLWFYFWTDSRYRHDSARIWFCADRPFSEKPWPKPKSKWIHDLGRRRCHHLCERDSWSDRRLKQMKASAVLFYAVLRR